MSSLASRPLCVYASHLHIAQWSVTWCSAAPAPRWQITILHYRRKSNAQISSPCHAGGLPQWRCSNFLFFIRGICVRFHLSRKKKKLNKIRSPKSSGLSVWAAAALFSATSPLFSASRANEGQLLVLETPSGGFCSKVTAAVKNLALSLLVARRGASSQWAAYSYKQRFRQGFSEQSSCEGAMLTSREHLVLAVNVSRCVVLV